MNYAESKCLDVISPKGLNALLNALLNTPYEFCNDYSLPSPSFIESLIRDGKKLVIKKQKKNVISNLNHSYNTRHKRHRYNTRNKIKI